MNKEVKQISYDDTKPFLLKKHYAHRMPSISYAYGLFIDGVLHGVIAYGCPASRSLQTGFFGKEYADYVIELNRLYVDDEISQNIDNITSYFVGVSLRDLKQYNKLVVSFADSGQYHLGGIYQATNFLYLGKTPQRTDKFSGFNKHSRHYDKNKQEIIIPVRSSKYKYIYFAMNKRLKNKLVKLLKYDVKPYPKDLQIQHYKVGDSKQMLYKVVATGQIVDESDAKRVYDHEAQEMLNEERGTLKWTIFMLS